MNNGLRKPTSSIRWLAWFLGCAVSAIVVASDELPYYDSADFTPVWLDADDSRLESMHSIAPFSLTDQHGDTVSDETTQGRLYVVSFFFSSCPGICPTLKSQLSRVQDRFRGDERLLILSHSIRPSNDTPEVLRAYATRNSIDSPNWHLLTGPRDVIYRLAKTSYFADEDLGEASSLERFLHTENLLLIDTQRRIRGVYNGLSDASVRYLIDDIELLLSQQVGASLLANEH
ncbi:MAG: SCO family protein [Pseudomonadota bacterium]